MTDSAVAGRIAEVRIYRKMARMVHAVGRRCMDGIKQEESLIRPGREGNCLNWLMGHLLYGYDNILPALGQETVSKEGSFNRYGRGTAGIEAAQALNMADLMAAWDEAEKRIEAGLEGITAERLDEPAPFSPSNNPKETMRSLLTTVFFHQSYHVGQAGLLRRIAGKPGAIG